MVMVGILICIVYKDGSVDFIGSLICMVLFL